MPWLDWPAWLAANGAARPQARGRAALLALRPGDPGRGRRAGRRARPHSADRRAPARRPARRAVPASATIRRAATTRSSRRTRARATDVHAFVRGCARKRPPMRASLALTRHGRTRSIRTRRAHALAVDRALRAARRAAARACSTSPPGAAGTRASSPRRGASVVAVDRDADALAALAGVARVETRVLDLEAGAWPLARRALRRDRRRQLPAPAAVRRDCSTRCRDDGVLLYETFAAGNEAYGRPSNPDFLLRRDELLIDARARPPDRGRPSSKGSRRAPTGGRRRPADRRRGRRP